jgi:general secretion pathway protein I
VKELRRKGFTLIELLIALVVFAVSGFAVTSRVGDVSTQTFGIERRTMAHWVAENHLARVRLQRRANTEPLSKGRDRERVFMGGRQWRIDTETTDTSHPWLRRVEIQVFEMTGDREVGPLDSLVAFVGRY